MDKELPKRKRNRLKNYNYSSCGAYFITICTFERRNYFWDNLVGADPWEPPKLITFASGNPDVGRPSDVTLSQYGRIVDEAINGISSIYPVLSIEKYVIMPNHVHLLLRIRTDEFGRPMVAPTISRIVNQLKGYVAKRTEKNIWQKSFHDHVIRNYEDYEEHVKYIHENPARWYFDELYSE